MYDVYMDNNYRWEEYSQLQPTVSVSNINGDMFPVTNINGLTGPVINLVGGASGFSFSPASPSTLTLVSPLTTKGDIYTRTNAVGTRLPVGVPGEVLTPDPGETTGLKWAAGATPTALDVTTITVADSPYSLTDANDLLRVDASGGPVTVNLHAVATAKQKPYYIKKIDASANAVTMEGNGGDTIDGALNQNTVVQYTSYTLIPDNTDEWSIV